MGEVGQPDGRLAEGQPAVVGRHLLVGEHFQTTGLQALAGGVQQDPVDEDAAAEPDGVESVRPGDACRCIGTGIGQGEVEGVGECPGR